MPPEASQGGGRSGSQREAAHCIPSTRPEAEHRPRFPGRGVPGRRILERGARGLGQDRSRGPRMLPGEMRARRPWAEFNRKASDRKGRAKISASRCCLARSRQTITASAHALRRMMRARGKETMPIRHLGSCGPSSSVRALLRHALPGAGLPCVALRCRSISDACCPAQHGWALIRRSHRCQLRDVNISVDDRFPGLSGTSFRRQRAHELGTA